MIGMTLGWLNASQLIGSFIMLAMTGAAAARSWPFTSSARSRSLGLLGIVLCDGIWVVVSAAAAASARP